MGLLQDIQNTAARSDVDIVSLLRQAKILAVRLGYQEFHDWIERELNGYPSVDVTPSYRMLRASAYGNFHNGIEWRNRASISPGLLPEKYRPLATSMHLTASVMEISSWIAAAAGPTLCLYWSAEYVAYFRDQLYKGWACTSAWQEVQVTTLRTLVEIIRNKVLGFALELEKQNPLAGETSAAGFVEKASVEHAYHRQVRDARRIFIGHGRSAVWKDLRQFLSERLGVQCDEFNREPTAGRSIKERLQEMLDDAMLAFLVMTAEDEKGDGSSHARENVVHEVGLFQGRIGFERAIILLEDGCSRFSNIEGLTHIPFPKGHIEGTFEEVRRVLEREGVLKT
jgi:predicted nucleotide-binding protein